MAGNTPNVAPSQVQNQVQENTMLETKNTTSDKFHNLCKTIAACTAAAMLATTPVNAQPTNTGEVTMETVVVIEGKEYTYGQLYNMSFEMRAETLRKIPSRGERENVRSGIISLQKKAIVQGRIKSQELRELNQLITIVSDKTRPIAERRQAFNQFQEGVRNSTVFTEEQKQSYYAQFPMIAQMLNR